MESSNRHSSRSTRRWVPWVVGPILGALAVLSVPFARAVFGGGGESHTESDDTAAQQRGGDGGGGERPGTAVPVTGKVYATMKDFGIDDPTGHRVLQIAHLEARVDAEALRRSTLRMPSGEARGIELLIRRGQSGRVSLSDAVHGGQPPSPAKARKKATQGMLLDIGPLQARDVRLRVAMAATPVVLQLSKARLRVERDSADQPTRILFSDIQGKLVSPDPLPEAIEIHDGSGVVNLAAGPLVDFKVLVCVADGELRLQIKVPERTPEVTTLVVDGDRFMGVASAGVLNVVDWFKGSIQVENGDVEVAAERRCEDG